MTRGRSVMVLRYWRLRLIGLVEDRWFSHAIIGLILVNAAVLGLETSPQVTARHGALLRTIDQAILVVFVIELTMRLVALAGLVCR